MNSENLTPAEFDAHIEGGTFRLSFVGMSNAGKSYRSRKLHDEKDFLWYHVDEEIQKSLGLASIEDVSQWMGYPNAPGYAANEQKYLDLENKFTKQASMQTGGKNLVFDTTGSVTHLKPDTLDTLRSNCLIVNLEVEEAALEEMMKKFFSNPKPVAWGGYFDLRPGEALEEGFKRSYPMLLKERLEQYRKLAHINIPTKLLRDTSALETLQIIRGSLR